jgi:hypothetical protein
LRPKGLNSIGAVHILTALLWFVMATQIAVIQKLCNKRGMYA